MTQFYHGAALPDGRRYFGGTQDNGTVMSADFRGSDLKPEYGDPASAVLLFPAGAAFGNGRRVAALVEENEGAFVEAEAVEVLGDLLEAVVEGVPVLVAAHLELGGKALYTALGQGPTQIDGQVLRLEKNSFLVPSP